MAELAILALVALCFLYRGGGGGMGPNLAEIIACTLAGIIGCAILAGVWFAGFWAITHAAEWMGWTNAAPILGAFGGLVLVGTFTRTCGAIDDRYRRRKGLDVNRS